MRRYNIVRGQSLNIPMQDKLNFCDGTGYTFIVNNAHTIVHIVTNLDPDDIHRGKLPGWLKGVSDIYLQKFLLSKYSWLLKTTEIRIAPDPPEEKSFSTTRKFKSYLKRHGR